MMPGQAMFGCKPNLSPPQISPACQVSEAVSQTCGQHVLTAVMSYSNHRQIFMIHGIFHIPEHSWVLVMSWECEGDALCQGQCLILPYSLWSPLCMVCVCR